MNIPIVIQTLQKLSDWLACSKPNQDIITEIIKELEKPDIDERKLTSIKMQLSTKMLFHPKWLGDIYIPNFIGDGSVCAWCNYLSRIAEICQKNL